MRSWTREALKRARLAQGRTGVVFNGEIVNLGIRARPWSRCLNPDWTPAFPRAAGIVAEVGTWLSHAALVAWECNMTTIVGARGALNHIVTGDAVRPHSDGRVEPVY